MADADQIRAPIQPSPVQPKNRLVRLARSSSASQTSGALTSVGAIGQGALDLPLLLVLKFPQVFLEQDRALVDEHLHPIVPLRPLALCGAPETLLSVLPVCCATPGGGLSWGAALLDW